MERESQTAKESKSGWLSTAAVQILRALPPAMEPEGVRRIFERSEADRNLQYTGYIVRLTSDRIDKLQTYYGVAIRRHKDDLEGMKREVCVGLYHTASSND